MKPVKTRHAYEDVTSTSALLYGAGDLHRGEGEDEHLVDAPYLTDAAASGLPQRRPVLVRVDSAVNDDLADVRRPVHTDLLGDDVLDIERPTALGAVHARSAQPHGAAPLAWHAFGTRPVRGDVTVDQ